MAYISGVCTYHGENAHCENIADLKHVRGLLYFGQGKVHCFRTKAKKDADVIRIKKIPDFVPEQPVSETEAQAKQRWLDAIKEEENGRDTRIEGTVVSYNEDRCHGLIKGDDGVLYFAGLRFIPPDEFNRRFLVPLERVSLRARSAQEGEQFPNALDIFPRRVDLSVSAPLSFREEMEVMQFDEKKGGGRLSQVLSPMENWVYFESKDILTFGSVHVGARFWCGLKRQGKNGTFRAVAIEIIQEEKGETI